MLVVVVCVLVTIPQESGKDTGKTKDQMTNRDHPNYTTVKNRPEFFEEDRRSESCCYSEFNEEPSIELMRKTLKELNDNN